MKSLVKVLNKGVKFSIINKVVFLHKYLAVIIYFIIFHLFQSAIYSEPIAEVSISEGNVLIKRLGENVFNNRVFKGSKIFNGDAIKIGGVGYAEIIFVDDKSTLVVKKNTQFQFIDTRNSRSLEIEFGTVLNKINKNSKIKYFRVETPISVATIKSTEFAAIIDMSGVDQFICKEGSFDILNIVSSQSMLVNENQKAISNYSGNLIVAPAMPSEYPDHPENEILAKNLLLPSSDKVTIASNNSFNIKNIDGNTEKPIEEEIEEIEEIEEKEEIEEIEEIEDEDKKERKTLEPCDLEDPFSMGLGLGLATIDNKPYAQIGLKPVLNIGCFGFGFDLPVFVSIDTPNTVRSEEWDIANDPSIILDKLTYITYREKGDLIWAKYGSIDNMTLGQGGLIQGYSNMMEFPTVRRAGINAGLVYGPFIGEIFVSNIKDIPRGGTVTGLRGAYTVSNNFPITVGINFVSDGNMFSSLIDKDKDTYPDIYDDFPLDSSMWSDTDNDGLADPNQGVSVPDSLIDGDADGDGIPDDIDSKIELDAVPFSLNGQTAKVSGFSIDIGYPIISNESLELTLFSEFNSLSFPSSSVIDENLDTLFFRPKRSGTGIVLPGLRSIILGFMYFSIEYRVNRGTYIPQFFDQAYDLNKITIISNDVSSIATTKDMNVFKGYNDSWTSSGVFGSATFNLFKIIDFSASYANMKADSVKINSFNTLINIDTENIPKISAASAFYRRNNDKNPFDFENPSENTIMGYRVGYEISKYLSIIYEYKEFYRYDGSGELLPQKQTKIETLINF